MNNPLDTRPEIREYLYFAQWFLTGIQTVLSALFAFTHGAPEDWPQWFLGTLAVLPVLWAYLGVTAKANVTPAMEDERPPFDVD